MMNCIDEFTRRILRTQTNSICVLDSAYPGQNKLKVPSATWSLIASLIVDIPLDLILIIICKIIGSYIRLPKSDSGFTVYSMRSPLPLAVFSIFNIMYSVYSNYRQSFIDRNIHYVCEEFFGATCIPSDSYGRRAESPTQVGLRKAITIYFAAKIVVLCLFGEPIILTL